MITFNGKVVFDTVVTYYELRFENKGFETMIAQQKERTLDTFPIKDTF